MFYQSIFDKEIKMQTTTNTTYTNPYINTHGIDAYLKAVDAFKEKARTSGLTGIEHIYYNMLRGKNAKRGFTPITNATKLANGMYDYHAYTILMWGFFHMQSTKEAALRAQFALADAWTMDEWKEAK